MGTFSNDQYCEMVLLYGECQRNSVQTALQYAIRFPNDPHPTSRTIRKVVHRLRETGSTRRRPRSVNSGMRTRIPVEDVLGYALAHPHSSTREISQHCGLGRNRVWEILHKNGAHPYHVTPQQGLLPGDKERRFDWCNWVLNELEVKPAFLSEIIWSDEAKFSRNGMLNRHNAHYWALENPSWGMSVKHQVQWSINVWCGIWKDQLIGPVFYDGSLDGPKYLQLLMDVLPDFIEDVPLSLLSALWFQHDGAPPHKPNTVRQFLNNTFGPQIIGYGGHVEWPPRSPDLTPLDFFLWGYIKQQVYQTPPTSLIDLQQRVINSCATVTPQMLRNVHGSVLDRIQMCIVGNGDLFEHTRHVFV